MTALLFSNPVYSYANEIIPPNQFNFEQSEITPYGTWTQDEICKLGAGDSYVKVRLLITDISSSQSKIIGIDVIDSYADIGVSSITVDSKAIYNNGGYAKVIISYKDFGFSNSKTFTFYAP